MLAHGRHPVGCHHFTLTDRAQARCPGLAASLLLIQERLCRLAAAKSERRYLSVALSVALGRLATACCALPLAGILLYVARTFLHMRMHAATALQTSGADSTAWRCQARDYLPDSTGGSARLTRPGSWVKPSWPLLSSNTPTGVPGSSGGCSNCCSWQVSVSAMYQRLPWRRIQRACSVR